MSVDDILAHYEQCPQKGLKACVAAAAILAFKAGVSAVELRAAVDATVEAVDELVERTSKDGR
ncbi:MAG: hypothetical protein R3322_00445 [Kiloniellales bacterium]|nr:hypothetical protein [Kiloniellales bacterium]